MTNFSFFLFWTGIVIVAYTYVGYGIVLWFLTKTWRKFHTPPDNPEATLPEVTHVIAAYNEESCIEDKVRNSLSLDYPPEKLYTYIVTDGSTDSTPEIVSRFPSIKLFHSSQRKGKIHAVNRVMKSVETPVVIFSDANTMLNREAFRKIVRHYQDETVGGVAGEKRVFTGDADNASGAGEGLYWKYESFLKKKDAELHSIVGAAGELFSVRTKLFEEPQADTIIEDFYVSLKIAAQGYRFAYEPEAYATETASASVADEWKRKVRICAGAFQAMGRLSYLLNPFKYGILSFQYLSHRVLRWTLAPLFLPLIFIANFILAMEGLVIYQTLFVLQCLFYTIAIAGHMMKNRKIHIKGFFVPYYFSVMNLSVYAGLIRFLKGKQSVVWEKAKRQEALGIRH